MATNDPENEALDTQQKQSLLENEIRSGLTDEPQPDGVPKKSSFSSSSQNDQNKAKNKRDINSGKYVYGKSPKSKVIPRHCLEKEDWINLLATPSRKYSLCSKEDKEKMKSTRYHKLAQPARHRIIATLRDRAAVLPASLMDRLINILEADEHLSLDEAEELFQYTPKKRKNRKFKMIECQGIVKPIDLQENYKMSRDAILCQYNIAETFVKSILQQKNVIMREDISDLAQVIQKQLLNVVDNKKINLDKDEKCHWQILFVAKLIANWVAGVLEEVAELNEEELKKECAERLKKLAEEEEEKEAEDEAEEYDNDDDDEDDEYDEALDTTVIDESEVTDSVVDGHNGEEMIANNEEDDKKDNKNIKVEADDINDGDEGVEADDEDNKAEEMKDIKEEMKEENVTEE